MEVDGLVNEAVIAEAFATYFKQTYTCNNTTRAAELYNTYSSKRKGYCGLPLPELNVFGVDLISQIITDLKTGKAPGLDGISVEHINYAHPSLVLILSKLFQMIFAYSYVPDGFGLSYIVPIPKLSGRSNRLSCNDFRGIAIAPVISKMLEHCVLNGFSDLFVSRDNQFGFKKWLGCSHAVYTTRKVVENIISGGGTANLC